MTDMKEINLSPLARQVWLAKAGYEPTDDQLTLGLAVILKDAYLFGVPGAGGVVALDWRQILLDEFGEGNTPADNFELGLITSHEALDQEVDCILQWIAANHPDAVVMVNKNLFEENLEEKGIFLYIVAEVGEEVWIFDSWTMPSDGMPDGYRLTNHKPEPSENYKLIDHSTEI